MRSLTEDSIIFRWTGLVPAICSGAAVLATLLPLEPAEAAATMSFGDDQSISVGLGLRTDFTTQQNGAPSGKANSQSFTLDSVRLYINASLNKYIKATFNTERASDGTINLLDGYARFEFQDEFNIWLGRMLPPSDRANLDGPYYINSWLYPGVVSQYPSIFDGRDDGGTVWGKVFDKKLVYSVGAFNGHNAVAGASDANDNLLYAARIAYNFWDAEPDPAYYTSSTYYGSVNVLTLAVAGQYEANGVGTATKHGDYTAWNIDGLFEKNLASIGVVTLEGAYYNYDTNGVTDVATNFNGAGPRANVGGLSQGTAYLVDGAFLFPQKFGGGQFQPFSRYQEFDNDLTKGNARQTDLGVNYVLSGHNARISLDYAAAASSTAKDNDSFILGLQLQF